MLALFRLISLAVVRLFYRQIGATNAENLPEEGPTILVANHPNGLMDPIVVQLLLKRPVSFLAKSTLFGNPVGRMTMQAFNALPVYRRRDGEDTSKNAAMFEGCNDTLEQGGAILLFPEGTSHSDPKMRPLKTGAARIALSAMVERGIPELTIVPVGLLYEAKEVFRSRVGVAAGEPIAVSDYLAAFEDDERRAVEQLTGRIADGLRDVVLEAADGELWQGFIATARATDPEAAEDVGICELRAREMSEAFGELMLESPDDAERLREMTRHYVRMLRSLGFDHPFLLDPGDAPTKAEVIAKGVLLAFLAPFAGIGALLGWPTYRMLGPIARKISGENRDLISTIKTIAGMVFLPLTFIVQGLIAAYFCGWAGFLAVFSAGFIFGRLALWWGEQLGMTHEAVSKWWLRVSSKRTAAEVLARRDELVAEIEKWLRPTQKRPTPNAE